MGFHHAPIGVTGLGAPSYVLSHSGQDVTRQIVESETVDTLLVPSNQQEYLPEIEDEALRSALIRELLLGEVLPALRAGPASTGGGYNVHWTFGDFRAIEGSAERHAESGLPAR